MRTIKTSSKNILLVTLGLFSGMAISSNHLIHREELYDILDTSEMDDHTCRRVKSFSKEKILENECRAQLHDSKKECRKLVMENVPEFVNEEQGVLVVKIMMSCPFSRIMDYPYRIMNGRPVISFPE